MPPVGGTTTTNLIAPIITNPTPGQHVGPAVDVVGRTTSGATIRIVTYVYKRANGELKVTPLGRFFIRNVAMVFDKYLPEGNSRTFSKTV